MSTVNSEEYIALLSDVSPEHLPDEKVSASRGASLQWPSTRWVYAAIVTLAIIVATDIFFMAYAFHVIRHEYMPKNVNMLELANPYIGLRALYESGMVNASKIDPILVPPLINAQVYRDHPNRLASNVEHDYYTAPYGTMSPHERHLEINDSVLTIVQFRAIDFGMEECSMVVGLPGLHDTIEGDSPFRFREGSVVDVYTLDAPRPLEMGQLSWRTRPSRREKVASVFLHSGMESIVARFPCPWGSMHTFELACAHGSSCGIDVWSSQNTTWGIYMYQHQTV